MLSGFRDRLTYANVMATAAVFIALGGTSYAAITLPRNSVGSNQIRSEAVRSSDIRDRSIVVRDISRAARESLEGNRGPQGERGAAGPKGDKGDPGIVTTPDGSAIRIGLTLKPSPQGTVAASDGETTQTSSQTATCDGGQRATGGGVRFDNPTGTTVMSSGPSGTGSWVAHVGSDATSPRTFTVYVICTP